ncbi:MAG TPA: RNA polymerase sigma factor [Chthonomonadaceae bacterium]|nr:RNA polymerase sigma factor [Chthonomonadaceae bacterium]
MTSNDNEGVTRGNRPGGQTFAALYREHGDRIYRFCYRLCGRVAEAEDLTQEVFVAAWQGLERFEGRSSVATWLYRIALYRWRSRPRSLRVEVVSLEETGELVGAEDPARAGLERLTLEHALMTLPPELREVFLLVKMEGWKYREAAEVLSIPQGTVQYRVHEAVCRLRALLQPETSASSIQENGGAAAPRKEISADAL